MARWIKRIGAGTLLFGLYLTSANAQEPTWVSIQGNVELDDGTPLCAMVLANGQYMFSCDGAGSYFLDVPLDANGAITLFSFADGFAPYSVTLGPTGFPFTVFMDTAPPDSPLINVTSVAGCADNNWVRLNGDIQSFAGDPLCAMVLANGQQMFTCGDSLGRYDLTVPADENGQITIFGFADGFQPFRETFSAPICDKRYAELNGVQLTYWLEEREIFSALACAVRVEALNTTSTTKLVTLLFDAFDAPNQYSESTYVNMYLPANSSDDCCDSEEGVFPGSLRLESCDYIYSWQLNTDTSMVR